VGCRVTTVTLSRAQHEVVSARIARACLAGRVTAVCADYRELSGRYPKIASIEMLEAVGHACHGAYFATCAQLLEPGGRLLVQTITVPDDRYEHARRNAEFMKRHVFPGGCLPSLARIASVTAKTRGLELVGEEDLTAHYVPTLRAWRERFADNRSDLARRGYPERLLRTWEWYLGICQAGFAERHTGDVQLLFRRASKS
jgi:cyclopropane-fatty-acyl-phospholipid synthase